MDDVRIALPRAVNLGPHKKVAMADLRTMASDLGLDDVRTILNELDVLSTARNWNTILKLSSSRPPDQPFQSPVTGNPVPGVPYRKSRFAPPFVLLLRRYQCW